MDSVVSAMRADARAVMKDMSTDVALLKGWFREEIGATWQEVRSSDGESKLKIEHRGTLPWDAIRLSHTRGAGGGEESIADYVIRHAKKLTPWSEWA